MNSQKKMSKPAVKRGRRPGDSTTIGDIRTHANAAFSRSGYDGVTVREIATSAGVDAALIFHYFKTKRGLFEAAIDIRDLATVPALAVDAKPSPGRTVGGAIGEGIVRAFLATWDPANSRATIAGLLRSASGDLEAMRQLTEMMRRTIVEPAIASIDARRGMPKLRAALVAAQLLGLAWTRYVLETEPIASASATIIARTFGPSIEHTLRGTDYGRSP